MDHTIAEEYKSSLNDLNFNSKPLINMLTMLADENKKHASLIVNTIINHINSVSPESKLPGLYLVDSIMKNLGDDYLKIFCEHITSLFSTVFEKVDENTRSLMFKLRQTWTDILPNKILYNLDVSVKKMDPAWPVTAKNPSKKILINPKFLDGAVEERKKSDVPNTVLKKEENKLKQRQGEVLKQLLAKQEQLRQLELKKLHMTMKKKPAAIGSTLCPLNSFTQNHIRDPRMVKINTVSQNVATQKATKNSVSPGKQASSLDGISPVSKSVKSEMEPINNNNKSKANDSSAEGNHLAPNIQSVSQKKGTLKCKYDKIVSVKNKLNAFKLESSSSSSSTSSSKETSINLIKSDVSKNEINTSKTNEKGLKEISKGSKNTPKKKSTVSENSKNSQIVSVPVDVKKKTFSSPKNEKLKNLESKDTLFLKDKKVSIDIKVEPVTNTPSSENKKMMEDTVKLEDPVNSSDFVKTEPIVMNVEPDKSDVKNVLHKDEYLRANTMPLNEEPVNKRILKREIVISDSGAETDKVHLPRKKSKSEDIKNGNPDYRTDSPVLFGNEDQDLRQPENLSMNEVKSKDWTQYKASHPDEYSSCPGRQEHSGKFKSRKYHFSGFMRHPMEYDRYGSFRFSRGKYASRRNVHRTHFPRGIRGRSFYNSSVGPVLFDSFAFLQQALERYRSGRISKSEYLDIRRDLQKMVESNDYHVFSDHMTKLQNIHHYERNPSSQKLMEECENKNIFPTDNLIIQGPSANPPIVKPFVLDGKERLIHFVDDKALILMDNKEPRELTFQDEPKTVYIEGAKPVTLGFDGKSAEFEVDGRRHILRFGTPGRELYINNHPYDIKFGGLPIAARLEDGHIYKIQLSGPPPQVIIGNQPQYELFDKCHNIDNSTFNQNFNHASEEIKSKIHNTTPESCSLQDIDMRMQPENVQQSDVLMNKDSPFYSEDMKDIDWRHIPPSNNVKSDESLPRMFEDNASINFKSWLKEDNGSGSFLEAGRNQSEKPVPEDSSTYRWKTVQDPPLGHLEKNDAPVTSRDENWYYKRQDKAHWQFKNYRQNHQLSHFEGYLEHQSPRNTVSHSETHVEPYDDRRNSSYGSYLGRPSFQGKQMQSQGYESSYGPWTSPTNKGQHEKAFNQTETSSTVASQQALLPSPHFPSDYPPFVENSILHKSPEVSTETAASGIPQELINDISLSNSFGSEVKPPKSSNSDLKVDVESLLQKLITAGIINTTCEQPPVESFEDPVTEIDDAKENATSEEIPEIELTTEGLKIYNVGVISALHKGLQCATCGMRFKELQNDQYSRHLDWHFRMNRREKDGAKKAVSRRWYYEIEDWIQFEEFEDFEERVPSYFELQTDTNEPEVPEVPVVISVPATNDDQEACPVCSERFQLFWVEEEEEWHFRDAVRHDNVTYHPSCYEDFKKTSEAVNNDAIKNEDSDLIEVDEDITILVNSLLDDVYRMIETDHETKLCEADGETKLCEMDSETCETDNETKLCETKLCSSLEIIQKVPSVEVNSEEEILEGKPGEEEIIGLISESDMDIDTDIPQTDSKMVVMQSGGITLKVKAKSLQCHSPSNPSEKESIDEDMPLEEEIDFRPPTPDPKFEVRPLVTRGRELSGLCSIM